MGRYKDVKASCDYGDPIPLYTTPLAAQKPWVGLTDEELKDLMAIYSGVVLYRAIEAKLKEKNT
jgi:hypothetical protein